MGGRRPGLAGRRLRRAVLAAGLPAGPGGAGRRGPRPARCRCGSGPTRVVMTGMTLGGAGVVAGLGGGADAGRSPPGPRSARCSGRSASVQLGLSAAADAGRLSPRRRPPGDRPAAALLRCAGALLRGRHPSSCGRLRRSSPQGATRARRRHRLHRHRPPDDLPREVRRAVRRGADGERLALLPGRRPGAAPRRRRREHGLRAGPARAAARCSSARSAATSPSTTPG